MPTFRCNLIVFGVLLLTSSADAGVIFSDDFDNINASQWRLTSSVGARGRGRRGFDFGNALHFAGWGQRTATTVEMDLTGGATITFDYRGGNEDIDGSLYWEDVDPGEDAVLEYSTDGTNYVVIDNLDLVQFRDDTPVTRWLRYSAKVPEAALTTATRFRWRQVNHSGWRWDEWAIDNVMIANPEPSIWVFFGLASLSAARIRRRRDPIVVEDARTSEEPGRR